MMFGQRGSKEEKTNPEEIPVVADINVYPLTAGEQWGYRVVVKASDGFDTTLENYGSPEDTLDAAQQAAEDMAAEMAAEIRRRAKRHSQSLTYRKEF